MVTGASTGPRDGESRIGTSTNSLSAAIAELPKPKHHKHMILPKRSSQTQVLGDKDLALHVNHPW